MRAKYLYISASTLLLLLVSLQFGAVKVNILEVLRGQTSPELQSILIDFRLPRVIAAFLAGALIAVTTLLSQRTYGSIIADPSITGISASAALGAMTAIALPLPDNLLVRIIFSASLAFVVTMLTFKLAKQKEFSRYQLVIIGFALTAFIGSLITIIVSIGENSELRSASFWLSGSISLINWQEVSVLAFATIALVIGTWLSSRNLDGLALGANRATILGYPVRKIQLQSALLISIGVGTLINTVGTIAFLGLTGTIIARALFGSEIRQTVITSALITASLLIFADAMARTAIAPAEIPISILTGLLGAPVIIWLIYSGGFKND